MIKKEKIIENINKHAAKTETGGEERWTEKPR